VFVAIGIQLAIHTWPAQLYDIFLHYLTNSMILERKGKKAIEHKMRILIFLTTSKTVLILRRTEQDMILNVYWSSCKVPVILVRV